MPRLPKESRDEIQAETRRRLLAAAAQACARSGFEGANVNRVSTAAGFARGTVYNYFPSKAALLSALVEEVATHHCRFVLERSPQEQEAAVCIRHCFNAGRAYAAEYPDHFQVLLSALYGPDHGLRQVALGPTLDLFDQIACGLRAPASGNGAVASSRDAAELIASLYMGIYPFYDEGAAPAWDPGQLALIWPGLDRWADKPEQRAKQGAQAREASWKQW